MELELIYFNFPFWRAEVPRLALHLAGVSFYDHRVSGLEFREMKQHGQLPLGQLPILKVNGAKLTQSIAIARFCGIASGMYPEDRWQAAKVDEVFDVVNELTYTVSPTTRERDLERKMHMRATIATKHLPKAFDFLEQQLEHSDSHYFVEDRLTIADLVVWRVFGWFSSGILDGVPVSVLEPYVLLRAHYERISENPRIKEWMSQYSSSK